MKDNSTSSMVLKGLKIIVAGKEAGDKVEVQVEELTINSTMGVEMDKSEYDATMSFAKELVQTTGVITNAIIDKRHQQKLEIMAKSKELGVSEFGTQHIVSTKPAAPTPTTK